MNTKKWLGRAAFFIVLGVIIFAGAMTACDWDFTKLSTAEYVESRHEIAGEFQDIVINTDTADVMVVPSADGKCRVTCLEEKNARHGVEIMGGALTIDLEDERKWYEHIGVNFASPHITVHIPEDMRGDISVNLSTGDICVENMTAETVNIAVSTGDVRLTDVKCGNFASEGSTGDVILNNVVAEEKIFIERSTGDVAFDGCDAGEIFVKTSTGDVTGSLLSGKVFRAQAGTGDVDVPDSVDGGMCEIITSTGDIHVRIK